MGAKTQHEGGSEVTQVSAEEAMAQPPVICGRSSDGKSSEPFRQVLEVSQLTKLVVFTYFAMSRCLVKK